MTGYSGYYTNGGYISTNYQTNGNDISTFLPTFRFTNSINPGTDSILIQFTEIYNYPSTFILTTSGTVGTSVYINTTTYRCGNWPTNGSAAIVSYTTNVATDSNLGNITNIPNDFSFIYLNFDQKILFITTVPVNMSFSFINDNITAFSASIIILS